MIDKIKKYLTAVFEEVPPSKKKDAIVNSYTEDLTETYENYIKEGANKTEAFAKTLSDFPDLEEVATKLAKEEKSKTSTDPTPATTSTPTPSTTPYSNPYYYNSMGRAYSSPYARGYYGNPYLSSSGFQASVDPALSAEDQKRDYKGKRACAMINSICWPVLAVLFFVLIAFTEDGAEYILLLFPVMGGAMGIVKFFLRVSFRSKKEGLYTAVWLFALAIWWILNILTELWEYTWLVFPIALGVHMLLSATVLYVDEIPEENSSKTKSSVIDDEEDDL